MHRIAKSIINLLCNIIFLTSVILLCVLMTQHTTIWHILGGDHRWILLSRYDESFLVFVFMPRICLKFLFWCLKFLFYLMFIEMPKCIFIRDKICRSYIWYSIDACTCNCQFLAKMLQKGAFRYFLEFWQKADWYQGSIGLQWSTTWTFISKSLPSILFAQTTSINSALSPI